MSWALVVKWWKKSAIWCRQHWRWLVLISAFVVVYYIGRGKSKALLIQAELARKQYKKEAEAIERAHQKEMKARQEATTERVRAADSLIRTKERQMEELRRSRDAELDDLSPEDIDKELNNMGIDKI